ncbi:MAG TPA: flagellar biosynthesis protein FlgB [Acidobacteriaceae bacterium]|jgi:flagellar basal-body rod protein FlgB|nr:flagellar biosynthesis protein FlgB [Acidobacteriaceae bacterium]
MSDFSSIQTLQGYLKVVSDRQQLVVSNMANVDTPGYHTKDIDFQASMRQVMNENSGVQFDPVSRDLQGLPERPDGNNVSIDRESLLLSQIQLQHQLGVELVKEQFHQLLTAIKEGN